MKYPVMTLTIIVLAFAPIMTIDAEATSREMREYTAFAVSGNDAVGTESFNINFTPYQLSFPVDESKSKTLFIASISCGASGSTTSFCELDVTIDINGGGTTVGSLPGADCTGFTPLVTMSGSTTNPSRGHGHSTASCTVGYLKNNQSLEVVYNEIGGITEASWSLEVRQIEVALVPPTEVSLPPAIESGAFIRDIREYHRHINQSYQPNNPSSFTLIRDFPPDTTDTVLLRNESESTLIIDYDFNAQGSPGLSNAVISVNVAHNSIAGPCSVIVSGEVGGTAKAGSLSCKLRNYQEGFTQVNVTISDPDTILESLTINSKIRQTETRLVPLMPQTITLEPFLSLIPVLFLIVLIAFAEWKRDPLYYILSGLLGLLITLNLPDVFPAYTRVFFIALSLYLIIRAYLSYSDARMQTELMDDT